MFSFVKERSLLRIAMYGASFAMAVAANVLCIKSIIDHVRWLREPGAHSMFPVSVIFSVVMIVIACAQIGVVTWSFFVFLGQFFRQLSDDARWWQKILASVVVAITAFIACYGFGRNLLLDRIAAAAELAQLERVAGNPFVSAEARILEQTSYWFTQQPIAQMIAESPYASPELLTKLFEMGNSDVNTAVAAHARTPGAILRTLIAERPERGWNPYFVAIAKNPSAPEDVLASVIEYVAPSSQNIPGWYGNILRAQAMDGVIDNPAASEDLRAQARKLRALRD